MANLEKLVEELSALTVLEAAQLSKLLEEKWGVSAAAPVAIAAAPGAGAGAPAADAAAALQRPAWLADGSLHVSRELQQRLKLRSEPWLPATRALPVRQAPAGPRAPAEPVVGVCVCCARARPHASSSTPAVSVESFMRVSGRRRRRDNQCCFTNPVPSDGMS